MCINLTQEFAFQTDDLNSLDLMLRAALPIIIPAKGKYKSDHIKLWIKYKKPPSYWDDGREFSYDNYRVIEIDNAWCVLDKDGPYYGVTSAYVLCSFDDREAACAYAYKLNDENKPKPTRLWVCTLGNYKDDRLPEDTKYSNHENMICGALEHLEHAKATREEELNESCYNTWEGGDGSHGIGYDVRVDHGVWQQLHLSICHFYYGK